MSKKSKRKGKGKRKSKRVPLLIYSCNMAMCDPDGSIRVIPAATTKINADRLQPEVPEGAEMTPIPWVNFVSGIITGSLAKWADVVMFLNEGFHIPLTELGAQLMRDSGDPRWNGLDERERMLEALRLVASHLTDMDWPDLGILTQQELEQFSEDPRELIELARKAVSGMKAPHPTLILSDGGEVRRTNFGLDQWIAQPPPPGDYLVKVQRPITTGTHPGEQRPLLIYNQNKSLHLLLSNRELRANIERVMGNRPKGFFKARFDEQGLGFDLNLQADPGW